MKLTESMPVKFGRLEGVIYGGPFRHYVPGTRRLVAVKMAQEIDHPHDIAVDTEDFSVPEVKVMQQGLMAALKAFDEGKDVYAGCMGGTGRTGTFMGCMAKAMMDYDQEHSDRSIKDPVAYVRAHYRKHAIETQEQMNYVRTFDTAPVLEFLQQLQEARTVYVDRTVEVERIVYLGPVEWAMHQFSNLFRIQK